MPVPAGKYAGPCAEERSDEPPLRYDGKRIVVTGACSGMSAASVQLLADSGARATREVDFAALQSA